MTTPLWEYSAPVLRDSPGVRRPMVRWWSTYCLSAQALTTVPKPLTPTDFVEDVRVKKGTEGA